jgi:hypothetical protein
MPKKGYKMSAEAIKQRTETRRRNNPNWFSPETIQKLRDAQIGRRYNKQARQNMSEAQFKRFRGHKPALETRAKISYERKKRAPMTAERREAQSYKMKIWWEKKKKAEADG